MDTLANVLNALKVAETNGKDKALVHPASKMVQSVLTILKEQGYIGGYEVIHNSLDGEITITLNGKINDCRIIKPRFPVKNVEWEKYERRFLPAQGMGILVVSTSKGVMTHTQAKEGKLGGRLLAFVY